MVKRWFHFWFIFTGFGILPRSADAQAVIRTLTLVTNPVEGGKISVTPLSTAPDGALYRYTNGTQVYVTATPAAGYFFTGFSGMPQSQQLLLNINADDHITANFSPNGAEVFTVATAAEGDGTVEISDTRFEAGWLTFIRAKPNPGSYFTHWTGLAEGENRLANPLFTGIYSNRNIVAHFSTNKSEGELVLRASLHPAGHLRLEWDRGSGRYQLQQNDRLNANGWTNIGDPITTSPLLLLEFNPETSSKFYRIISLP